MGWTKWAKRLLTASCGYPCISSDTGNHFPIELKREDTGEMFTLYMATYLHSIFGIFADTNWNHYGTAWINIGSGSTPESEEDYTTEAYIANSLIYPYSSSVSQTGLCQAQHIALSSEDNKYKSYIEVKGTNTTEADLIIREFTVNKRVNYEASNYYPVCLYRKVLDTPIVVSPGGTYSFKIRISE